jgi:hypothetical protein
MTRDRANGDDPERIQYQCPHCEVQTDSMRALHIHWMRVHSDEHGHFADVAEDEIEVVEE